MKPFESHFCSDRQFKACTYS